MGIENYYGWHVAERRHRHVAEGWQTVAIKYISTPIDQQWTKQRNLKEIG